jgi:hypothetical protein
MERNFEDLVRFIFQRPPQKIAGPEESISMPAPTPQSESLQPPIIGHLNQKQLERSSQISKLIGRHFGGEQPTSRPH